MTDKKKNDQKKIRTEKGTEVLLFSYYCFVRTESKILKIFRAHLRDEKPLVKVGQGGIIGVIFQRCHSNKQMNNFGEITSLKRPS